MSHTDVIDPWADIFPEDPKETPERPSDKAASGDPKAEGHKAKHNLGQSHRRRTACTVNTDRYLYRRAYGEVQLLEAMRLRCPQEGEAWHFITAGDVDSIGYVKMMLAHHQRFNYMLCATWVVTAEDILQIRRWIEDGTIGRVDMVVGSYFRGAYKIEWRMLMDMRNELVGQFSVKAIDNHSKIYAIEPADGTAPFVIETSCNMTTNPRVEQGAITVSRGLYEFYKDYFTNSRYNDEEADTNEEAAGDD